MLLEYSDRNAKKLAKFIHKAENVSKVEEALYPTNRSKMLLAQKFLVGDAATRWRQYHKKHLDAAWTHIKTMWTNLTAPPQQQYDYATQQLCNT